MDKLITEAANILLLIRGKISDNSELLWTSYETAEELRNEIDKCIEGLKNNDKKTLEDYQLSFFTGSNISGTFFTKRVE